MDGNTTSQISMYKKNIANFEGKILLLQKDFIFAESEHSAMIKIVSRNFFTKSVRKNISTYMCLQFTEVKSQLYFHCKSQNLSCARQSLFIIFFTNDLLEKQRDNYTYVPSTYFQYYKALWFAFFNYNHLLWLQSNMVAQNRMCERQQDDVVWPENSSKHSMVTRNQLTFQQKNLC